MYQHVNLSLSVFYNYISEYAFINSLFYLSEIVKTIIYKNDHKTYFIHPYLIHRNSAYYLAINTVIVDDLQLNCYVDNNMTKTKMLQIILTITTGIIKKVIINLLKKTNVF